MGVRAAHAPKSDSRASPSRMQKQAPPSLDPVWWGLAVPFGSLGPPAIAPKGPTMQSRLGAEIHLDATPRAQSSYAAVAKSLFEAAHVAPRLTNSKHALLLDDGGSVRSSYATIQCLARTIRGVSKEKRCRQQSRSVCNQMFYVWSISIPALLFARGGQRAPPPRVRTQSRGCKRTIGSSGLFPLVDGEGVGLSRAGRAASSREATPAGTKREAAA